MLAFVRQLRGRDGSSSSPTSRASCSSPSSTCRAFDGLVPVELFGGTEFPPIGELPYSSRSGRTRSTGSGSSSRPRRSTSRSGGPPRSRSPGRGRTCSARGPGGRSRRPCPATSGGALVRRQGAADQVDRDHRGDPGERPRLDRRRGDRAREVEYAEGDPETYVLPLSCASATARRCCSRSRRARSSRACRTREGERALHDALGEPERPAGPARGDPRAPAPVARTATRIEANPTKAFRRLAGPAGPAGEMPDAASAPGASRATPRSRSATG